jgi:hypothetical protein
MQLTAGVDHPSGMEDGQGLGEILRRSSELISRCEMAREASERLIVRSKELRRESMFILALGKTLREAAAEPARVVPA